MKFNKHAFLRQFVSASKACNGKLIEVYGNVRLQAKGSTATLCGTDTELYVQTPVTPTEDGELDILLPATKMSAILAECEGDELQIETTDSQVMIWCGTSKFKLQRNIAKDFFVPNLSGAEVVKTTVGAIKAGIKSTVFACDSSSTRYALGGVAFDFGSGALSIVGCDGRRASVYEIEVDGKVTGVKVIPERACRAMLLALTQEKDTDECTLSFNTNLAAIETSGGLRVSSSLIEGRYPNWRMVEPSKADRREILVDPKRLTAAIRQAAIFSDTETRAVVFNISGGNIKVASVVETGESEAEVPVSYSGEPIELRLDYKYTLDFVSVAEAAEPLSLFVADPAEPVLVTSGERRRYTLMPMSKS